MDDPLYFQYLISAGLIVMATIMNVILLLYILRFQHIKSARFFLFMLIGTTGWMITDLLVWLAPTEVATIFWDKLSYIFIVGTVVSLFLFAVQFSGHAHWFEKRWFYLLFILPFLTILLSWTNEWHGLIWQSSEYIRLHTLLIRERTYGAWFWVNTFTSYAMILWSFGMIIHSTFRSPRLQKKQSVLVILGVVIPFLFNVIYLFDFLEFLKMDFTPVSFSLGLTFVAIGLYRYRLFDLVPFAHDELIERMNEGMIVIDKQDRVVDINQSFLKLLNIDYDDVIGKDVNLVLKIIPELRSTIENNSQTDVEIFISKNEEVNYFDVNISLLKDEMGVVNGRLILLHDITERVRLFKQVNYLARIDVLTSLYNRRRFFELAEKEMIRHSRYPHPVSIIMIDIDHFKSINDTYGHMAADKVLSTFGAILKEQLREVDIIGRYGGEEFIVLMPETSLDHAVSVAERIRAVIENLKIEYENDDISFTCSFGVTGVDNPDGIDIDDLIFKADKAMYQAKARGRNSVASVNFTEE